MVQRKEILKSLNIEYAVPPLDVTNLIPAFTVFNVSSDTVTSEFLSVDTPNNSFV